jgi:hypothetical protein
MRRAVVWFCWGQLYIDQAIESAKSAAGLQIDRILITDSASLERAQVSGQFGTIISTPLVHGNILDKSRLIDLLPKGYETFLFLDCDTRILGDIALGFEKAERYGIAMAPAPNYNVCTFAAGGMAFGEIMRKAGTPCADQFGFNSGVIFFQPVPEVRKVLRRWRDLCAEYGALFPNDQPFLTLAMEQLGFNPYVLSPLYNYRALGEHAVGSIRVWHSHSPVPPDLNQFDKAWPARRYKHNVRLAADTPA